MHAPATAGLTVVRTDRDTDLLELAAVLQAVDADAHPSLENMHHTLSMFPHAAYFLARLEGAAIGFGYAGCFPGSERGPDIHANVSVVPSARKRGAGAAVLAVVSEHARTAGKQVLTVEVKEDDPGSLAWVERRGFVEVERQKSLELDLSSAPTRAVEPPPGVSIVRRAVEHEPGMYRVGLEAGKDIPGLDAEHDPSFEQWRSFEIERPSRRPELAFVALADGEVIGFASIDVFGESDTGWHGLTAVARAWRGRGAATALKRSQIEAARRLRLRRLITESEERNLPMRRLNDKLGYRPVPGMIVLQGALVPGN